MAERWIVEGEWSGYNSSQQKIVHREVISKKKAEEIKKLHSIRYTDNTYLYLTVRKAKLREKVEEKHGYTSLINKCLAHKVNAVDKLPNDEYV